MIPKNVTDAKLYTRRCKAIQKNLGTFGFTPYIAGVMSKILYEISQDTKARRLEAITMFTSIMEGKK